VVRGDIEHNCFLLHIKEGITFLVPAPLHGAMRQTFWKIEKLIAVFKPIQRSIA
jgi:hypothetical protein